MVVCRVLIVLCLGILSTVTGCSGDPSPYAISPHAVYRQQEPYQGHQYGGRIDYERKMDEQEQQYRKQRSAQERELEHRQQQWEQERERERGPRWER